MILLLAEDQWWGFVCWQVSCTGCPWWGPSWSQRRTSWLGGWSGRFYCLHYSILTGCGSCLYLSQRLWTLRLGSWLHHPNQSPEGKCTFQLHNNLQLCLEHQKDKFSKALRSQKPVIMTKRKSIPSQSRAVYWRGKLLQQVYTGSLGCATWVPDLGCCDRGNGKTAWEWWDILSARNPPPLTAKAVG